METAIAGARVQQLRDEAERKAEETAQFLGGLTPEQADIKTEIGWTVAATAAHLAASAGMNAGQLKALKRGKATRVPNWLIDGVNFITSRSSSKKPIAQSIAKIRQGTERTVPLLDAWADDELDKRFATPYYGANTYEEAIRYSCIGHYDEHLGQIRRAVGR
jgi:hypothetical protein